MKLRTRLCAVGLSFATERALALPLAGHAADQMKGGQLLTMKQIKTPRKPRP